MPAESFQGPLQRAFQRAELSPRRRHTDSRAKGLADPAGHTLGWEEPVTASQCVGHSAASDPAADVTPPPSPRQTSPREGPTWSQASGHTLAPRARPSPGPGCENWGSHSSASRPRPHVTQGSRIWRWWASSRSQPPGHAGRPPAEVRGGLHLPTGPIAQGQWAGEMPHPCPPTYLLSAHLLGHHDDAVVALHRGGQGQPDPWGQHMQ